MTKVFVTPDRLERNGRFIDTRFDLQNPMQGQALYEKSHIKGAIFWSLERDLSDMKKNGGRHPLPEKQVLQNLFEKSGLSYDEAIYIYDQGGAPFATRAWWILKYAGFQHVYIVNGGYEGLVVAGFETTTEVPHFKKTALSLQWNEDIYASRLDVKRIVEGKEFATLLDARAAGRYRGEFEPLDPVAGHIPTAKNFDWEQLKDGKQLVANKELLNKVSKDEEIVVYCGSGVTATPVYTILTEAGYKNIRLFVGGYSEWVANYEVEVGENL
ncbi:sulfurtransferase [Solibacillus sp. FSL H8-0538]|uniref:sulfurtransferase n=1 Tax=Solibacillus sp. FSL H8-0538 TaxID=2921400 RepID=UPI0030FA7C68